MKTESITAPPKAQDPAQANAGARPLPNFTVEQKQIVADLIKAERNHASRWWTYLNEMRFRKELPEWVRGQLVGSHPDYDRWEVDCKATNLALLGISYHINGFNPAHFLIDELRDTPVHADGGAQ